MRSSTAQYEILRALFFLTSCWMKDIKLIVRGRYSDAAVTKAVSKLISDGLAAAVEKEDKKSGRYKMLFITGKGRRELADSSEEEYFYDDHHFKNYEKRFRRYRSTADDVLFRKLTGNRAKVMFEGAEVRTFPIDKPTLYRIFFHYLPKSDVRWKNYDEACAHDSYYAEMNDEELEQAMNDSEGGFYYTAEEYRLMLDQLSPNTSDTIRGSRFRGIYFNRYTCLAVYVQEPGKIGMIGIAPDTENKLAASLKWFAQSCLPGVFRSISEIGISSHGVNALIISNGYSMIYSMVTGYRNGIIKAAANGKELVKASGNIRRLMYGDARYPRLFVTPANVEGVDSLYYLTHSTPERWIADSKAIIARIRKGSTPSPAKGTFNELPPGNGLYAGVFQKVLNWKPVTANVVYLPVCEVNLLRQMSVNGTEAQKDFLIFTDMSLRKIDAIDHCLRKPVIYCDADSGKEIYYSTETGHLITMDSEDYQAAVVTAGLNDSAGYGFRYSDEEKEAVKAALDKSADLTEVRTVLESIRANNRLNGAEVVRHPVPVMIQTYGYNGLPIDEKTGNGPEKHSAEKKSKPAVSALSIYVGNERYKTIRRAAGIKGVSISRFCADILSKEAAVICTEEDKRKKKEIELMRNLTK